MTELKPCPICERQESRVEESAIGPYIYISHADDCPIGDAGFYVKDDEPNRAARIEAWNRRPSPSISEGEVEAAARAIWNRADDEIGWEQSKRMPDMQPSIEWALDDARAALLAASKARSALVGGQ